MKPNPFSWALVREQRMNYCWRMKGRVESAPSEGDHKGSPLPWTNGPGKWIHSIVGAIPCGHALSVAHLISTRTVIRQQSLESSSPAPLWAKVGAGDEGVEVAVRSDLDRSGQWYSARLVSL